MQRFEFWRQAVSDTADNWSHLAQLLRASQQEIGAHGALGDLAIRSAAEAASLAAAAQECAEELRGVIGDVATAETRVVADLTDLLRRTTGR